MASLFFGICRDENPDSWVSFQKLSVAKIFG